MRMKKLFAFGLMLLVFALAQSWVPTKSVPIDDDVGVCFIDNMDQATVDMVFIADNQFICHPDYESLLSDVEKSDYSIYSFSQTEIQYSYVNGNHYSNTWRSPQRGYVHNPLCTFSAGDKHGQPWAG